MNTPWSQTVSTVLAEFKVDHLLGLTEFESQEKLKNFGHNVIAVQAKTSRLSILLRQLKNPVVYILVLASIIAFGLKEYLEGYAIVAIVILNTLIGYFQEAKAETSLEALAKLTAPKCRVLRDGDIVTISSENLCPGDILILEAGDYVAADARIIIANQLAIDESILTGESLPVEKQTDPVDASLGIADRKNMVYASTAVGQGSGRAVVTSTGKSTEIGKISTMLETAEMSMTPLQKRLEIVSRKLLLLGLIIVILVVIIEMYKGTDLVTIIMTALSLSIAAIPEGLPTVVTLGLVMAVRRMTNKKALVRKLDAVETLGATDIICTDKTGTLTTGKMQVREVFVLDGDKKSHFYPIMILCNNASLAGGGSGDTTELSLLTFADKECKGIQDILRDNSRLAEWSFDSVRKRMSVAIKSRDMSYIYVKGAPESMLSQCLLTPQEQMDIQENIDAFSHKGMRVLALAYKEIKPDLLIGMDDVKAESSLVFSGLVAMADPPRLESFKSIEKCKSAGIKVIMITGDHPRTAQAIAKELGIIDENSPLVMTGTEMDNLSEEELERGIPKVAVFARVSPANKLRLVRLLKNLGHVVAMTGDGVNDAPALKVSSIGVAMGRGGTEVARQAASIVLTDDNFSTIVDAVEEGRAVNGNIKRSLQYLLSTNLAELLFILGSAILGWPVPLLPINILWLNLVTDGLPALALATEDVTMNALVENPKPSGKTFFDRPFFIEMLAVSTIITIMCAVIYFYSFTHYDVTTSRSISFTFIVYIVLFRSFASRSDRLTYWELKFSPQFLFAVLVPLVFQILMQESDFLLHVFKIKPLSLLMNLYLITLALIPVTIIECFKIWRRKWK